MECIRKPYLVEFTDGVFDVYAVIDKAIAGVVRFATDGVVVMQFDNGQVLTFTGEAEDVIRFFPRYILEAGTTATCHVCV